MTDEELFATAKPKAAPKAARMAPVIAHTPGGSAEGDPAIWTVLGEAGSDPEGQKAVASTIANRAKAKGLGSLEIVTDPSNGYEAWQNAQARAQTQARYPVGSPAYEAARAAVQGILTGSEPAPYAYDHFYSPKAQEALGRQAPDWAQGEGADIGGNRFYALNDQGAPSPMTKDDEAEWERLYGTRDTKITPTGGTPNPGPMTKQQADTAKFLKLHGFFDENATPGSSTLPLAVTQKSGAPTLEGQWYIPREGGLRQVGSDEDFLPKYQTLVGTQKAAMEKPLLNRITGGAGQGVEDVAGSVNKLLAGGMGAPMGMAGGVPVPDMAPQQTADLARGSVQDFARQRDEFNLVHGPDAASTVGRIGGNMLALGGPMAGTEGAIGAGASALGRAAPFVAPALDVLGGGAQIGNPLLRAATLAPRGAFRGGEAGALLSGTSDAPLGEQVRQGALTGAVAEPATALIPGAAAGTANALLGGNRPTAAVRDLANLAVDQYGIPLRVSQIKGVGDRAMAIADSERIGKAGNGYAANNAQQRQAFTRAVAGTFGEQADALTPQVMQRARDRIGGEFDRIAANTTIADADSLQARLGQIVNDAQQAMPDNEVAPLMRQVENIGSVRGPDGISGASYQALTRKGSPLDVAQHSSNSNIRHYAGEIRSALDDALEANAAPEDLAALRQARFQYKNLMTIKDLAAKAGVEGEISPQLLQGAVNKSFKNRAFQGAGDLGELSDIAQTFMKEPGNSQTSERLLHKLAPYLASGGVGANLMLAMHDPVLASKLAGGAALMGGAKLGADAVTGAYNRSPLVRNLLLNGVDLPPSVVQGAQRFNDLTSPAYVPLAVDIRNRLTAPAY